MVKIKKKTTMQTLTEIGTAVAEYLAQHWDCACTLIQIEQIPGGASRETYYVLLNREEQNQAVVLRRDPASSLIDTDRTHEYRTYQAVHRSGIMPVPEPIVLETSQATLSGKLERPFSIMSFVAQGRASPAGLDTPEMKSRLLPLVSKNGPCWASWQRRHRKRSAWIGSCTGRHILRHTNSPTGAT